jgi:hypothetical protein
MSLFLVDISEEALAKAEKSVKEVQGVGEVYSMVVDVGNVAQVIALREKVFDVFGEVSHAVGLVVQAEGC